MTGLLPEPKTVPLLFVGQQSFQARRWHLGCSAAGCVRTQVFWIHPTAGNEGVSVSAPSRSA
jgi:hypothetical protein